MSCLKNIAGSLQRKTSFVCQLGSGDAAVHHGELDGALLVFLQREEGLQVNPYLVTALLCLLRSGMLLFCYRNSLRQRQRQRGALRVYTEITGGGNHVSRLSWQLMNLSGALLTIPLVSK